MKTVEPHTLGRSGIAVSRIAFGCVALGKPYGPHSDSPDTMLTPAQAVELLHDALDHGVNFFDTAPSYGRSERVLGDALRGRRAEAVICTKCAHDIFDAHGAPLPPARLEAVVRASLRASLDALRTNYVDVFLAHRVTDEALDTSALHDAFARLKADGLVRAIGLSTYGAGQARRAIDSDRWDVLQVAYNLLDQSHHDVIHSAHRAGVGVMVRSVLCKGVLTDGRAPLHPRLRAVEEHCRRIEALPPAGMTLAELATRFVMRHPGVSATLIGIDRDVFLRAALDVAARPPLPDDLYARARASAFPDPAFLDLPRWHREGWLT